MESASKVPHLQPDLVFDIGAHKGEDSNFYLKLGFRVVAVEANPELGAQLKQRFATEIKDGKYKLINKAIGSSSGEVSFFVNKMLSIWGTTDPKWARRNKSLRADSEEIKVQSVRFAEIFEAHGCPHYLKVDIEGADMLCVRDLEFFEQRPKYLSIEASKTSWRELNDELNELEKLGYTKFKIVDQRSHPTKAFMGLHGGKVEYGFRKGESGPFGEYLEGPWLSKRQTIFRYIPIFLLYMTAGDNKVWIPRIIRRIPLLRRLLGKVSWYDTHAMRA